MLKSLQSPATFRWMPLFRALIIIVFAASLGPGWAFAQEKPSNEVSITKCWSYSTGDDAGAELVSDASRVFIAFVGAKLEAVSGEGQKLWSADFGGDIASNLVIANTGLFVVTAAGADDAPKVSTLRSLNPETGLTQWLAKLPQAERHFLDLANGSLIIISTNGVVQALDPANGGNKWQRQLAEGFVSRPVVTGDRLYLASTGKQLFVLKTATGEIDAMQKVPHAISAIAPGAGDSVVLGDERGNISSISAATGKTAWQFRTGGLVSSLFAVDGHVLVTSHDNFAYFLESRKGGLAWKRRLTGRVAQAIAIGEQYALTSAFEEHGATFADLSSGKIAGQIALGPEEIFVTTPVVTPNGIFGLTNLSVYRFALNGCAKPANTSAKKE